jgi:hypothetical protein
MTASAGVAAQSGFPAAGAIAVLLVIVVVVMALTFFYGRLSWRSRGRRPRRRLSRIQRNVAAEVADIRENDDLYDPDGPGQAEDEL